MGLQSFPPTSGTVSIVHSGTAAGEAFTGLFTGADGAPTAPADTFHWTLTGTDLEGLFPVVSVYEVATNEQVIVDVKVTSSIVSVYFRTFVDPAHYRIKVTG